MRSHLPNNHAPDLEIIAIAHRRVLWLRRSDIILQCRGCGEISSYTTGGHVSISEMKAGDHEDTSQPRG